MTLKDKKQHDLATNRYFSLFGKLHINVSSAAWTKYFYQKILLMQFCFAVCADIALDQHFRGMHNND